MANDVTRTRAASGS